MGSTLADGWERTLGGGGEVTTSARRQGDRRVFLE